MVPLVSSRAGRMSLAGGDDGDSPVDGHDREDRSIRAPKFLGPPISYSPLLIFCSPGLATHDRSFAEKNPVAIDQLAFLIVIESVSTRIRVLM
jgi:hypothetical protein